MSQDDSHATFYATVVNAAITVCGVGGGVLADAVWGKLKVQVVTSWVWMAGVVALLASVLLGRHTYGGGGDANSETGPPPSFGTAALAAAGLALLSVGYGAQQPSQTGFVGDQTPHNTAGEDSDAAPSAQSSDEAKSETALLLPAPQAAGDGGSRTAVFYAWFYFWENAGAVLGETVCPILRQHVSFTSLFAACLACQMVSLAALTSGYWAMANIPPERAVQLTYKEPDDAPAARPPIKVPSSAWHWCCSPHCFGCPAACALLCGGTRRTVGGLHPPNGHMRRAALPHGCDFTQTSSPTAFFSSASHAGLELVPVRPDAPIPTCLPVSHLCCSDASHKVEYGAKDWASLWRVGVLFVPLTLFWSLYYQQNNTWVTQASAMDLSLVADTPDLLGSVNDVMVCAMVPLFTTFLYPAVTRCGIACTPLRRMGVGILAAALAFVAAGLVQVQVQAHPHGALSVAWQLPQYLLISVSETTIAVTGLEFAYTQVTHNVRGAVQALWVLAQLGQLLTGIVALIDVGTLADKFFFFAGLMFVFGIVFLVLAMRYKYATPADVGVAEPEGELLHQPAQGTQQAPAKP